MRAVLAHKSGLVGDPNDRIAVLAKDARGPGNANQEYLIRLEPEDTMEGNYQAVATVDFQQGPLQAGKFNGASNESVLAIVIDRLEGFQQGPFACDENAEALRHLKEAMMHLHARTRNRMLA